MNPSNRQSLTGLTINLISFTIPSNVILETDQLRVKAKTFPEEFTQKIDLKAKKMSNCNLTYRINFSSQTQMLFFVFRKKTYLSGNKTIGTASMSIEDIMKTIADKASSSALTLDIYMPIERQLRVQQPRGSDRSSIKEKVIGQMKITISQSEPVEMERRNSIKKTKKDGSNPANGNHCTENLL